MGRFCKSSVKAFWVQAFFSLAWHIVLPFSNKNCEEKGNIGVFTIPLEKLVCMQVIQASCQNLLLLNEEKPTTFLTSTNLHHAVE